VRLVVNEIPYTGPPGAGQLCMGRVPDVQGGLVPRFQPVVAGPRSFVLADKLASCHFIFLEAPPLNTPSAPDRWRPDWVSTAWPLAVRVELEPLDPDPARLRPVTVTAAIRVDRSTELQYADY
jgi:hypothetical protein